MISPWLWRHKFTILIACSLFAQAWICKPDWGFYGHRLINRMAVFTLPSTMMSFFKPNIKYLQEHAVDPDMRRYATKYEAMRHYMDIDHWDTIPFRRLPRDFGQAMVQFGQLYAVDSRGDSSQIDIQFLAGQDTIILRHNNVEQRLPKTYFMDYVNKDMLPTMYEDQPFSTSSLQLNYWLKNRLIDTDKYPRIVLDDRFTAYGILPYYLEMGYGKLVAAFKKKNKSEILRHAADFGHYLGDAHVPLHTTSNYNGQKTDQLGIHAFWESRLPELFAEKEYDFIVGKAEIIPDIKTKIWDIIIDTHRDMPKVLAIEKELSKKYPSDKQWCFDNRLDLTVRIQCKEYSEAYHKALQGMVERKMTQTIKALGDFWYTAWIEAGSPRLSDIKNDAVVEEKIIANPNVNPRAHDN